MSTPTQIELDEAPTIKIAGQEFRIPMLTPMQNRRIIPRLGYLLKLSRPENLDKMTEQDMDNMYEVIYWALTRTRPDLKLIDLMNDWVIPMHEVMEALPVIARQTGMMRSGVPQAGEAKEEALSTGTSSLPESASTQA